MLEMIKNEQMKICKKYNAEFLEAERHLRLGIARNVKENLIPINGHRHKPEGNTTGWYIWAGEEFSEDDDFFESLHVAHIDDWVPGLSKYLGLAPGWRFLIAGEYVDVWYDPELLKD